MLQFLLAILAGMLTIGAPCILPLLPILLATSIGRSGKFRPLFIIGGFIISFAVVALALSYLVSSLMIAPDILRKIAIFGLFVFGLFMLFPSAFEKITSRLGRITTKADALSREAGSGNFGGFVLGLLLGLIWTPCAGPVLGAILTLIATSSDISQAGILLVAYAIGAGIPMLVIAYGSQYITTKVQSIARYSRVIQKCFGLIVIIIALSMYLGYDLLWQAKLLEYFPTLVPKL